MTHPFTNRLLHGLVVLALVLGCFSGCEQPPTEAAKEGGDAAHSKPKAPSIVKSPHGEEETDPEAAASQAALSMSTIPYEELGIPTTDGITLMGRLYDPSQKPESDSEEETLDNEVDEETLPDKKFPTIILLHGLNGSFRDWNELPMALVQAGYAVIAIDMRGHGKSALGKRSWRHFSNSDWPRLVSDVPRIVGYFDAGKPGNEAFPQVDNSRIGIVGSSLGANVAILAGARDNKRILALVTLSPSQDYKGLQTVNPIYRYPNAILMAASQNDTLSFESTNILYQLPKGHKSLKLFKNIGHGTDMLRNLPDLNGLIVGWLVNELPPTPATIVYPEEEGDEEEE